MQPCRSLRASADTQHACGTAPTASGSTALGFKSMGQAELRAHALGGGGGGTSYASTTYCCAFTLTVSPDCRCVSTTLRKGTGGLPTKLTGLPAAESVVVGFHQRWMRMPAARTQPAAAHPCSALFTNSHGCMPNISKAPYNHISRLHAGSPQAPPSSDKPQS
jgi:hypothetical protein